MLLTNPSGFEDEGANHRGFVHLAPGREQDHLPRPEYTAMASDKKYGSAFALITVLFFLWGFITVLVDSLIPRLRDVFELSYFESGLVQFAFFAAYFLLSIPAGFILARIGYQRGIVWGLGTMAAGCLLFYPAAEFRVFPVFLFGYFTLAGGITVLQVAANPFVTALGTESGASSRLNLSQAFNALGTMVAPIIGASFLLSDRIAGSAELSAMSDEARTGYLRAEAAAVQEPFLILAGAIAFLAVVFALVRLPQILQRSPKGGYRALLRKPKVRGGVLAVFLYVGAEVAIGSYLVNYFLDMGMTDRILASDPLRGFAGLLLNGDPAERDPKAVAGAFTAIYWSGAMVGRFISAYLTRIFAPGGVLTAFAALALTAVLVSMNTEGFAAMFSILAVGLFNSIMFPTVFSLTLDGLGDLKPQASGLLCTAIAGGAVIPGAYGYLTDLYGFKPAFTLLLFCYAYVAFFGRRYGAGALVPGRSGS